MMDLRRLLDLPLLVILMGIGSVAMVLPAAYGVVLGQFDVSRAFFYSGCVLLVLTAMIAIATATYRPRNPAQSQLASAIGAYLVLPILLAVPLHQSMPGLRFGAAWFEMLSCFTTTGATMFETPGVVFAPIHLWRALVGWMGGFYALLVAASVLAPLGLGGVELLAGRSLGQGGGRVARIAEPSQRIIHYSTKIFPVYSGLTLFLWVALLLSGDSALVGLAHAMGTLSASGVSAFVGLDGAASGLKGEALIFGFMCFAITRRIWPGTTISDKTLKIWQDPELRLAVGIVMGVTAILALRHTVLAEESARLQSVFATLNAMWGAMFTVLSFLTTTGYQSNSWPDLGSPGLVLLGLAMIGGGVATTAGGIKLLRVYALLRHGERELERIVHPHSIGGHGPIARRLRREGAYLAWIFFMIFGLSIAGITAALTLAGIGFQDALVLCIACLSTTGQLATMVGDAPISYAHLDSVPMAILGVAMILGRLEILAVFALLVPKGWSK